MLQLRWFDDYLKGIDNGVDRQPPLGFFVIGDNTWRQEQESPLARTVWTNVYLRQDGLLDSAGACESRRGSRPSASWTSNRGVRTGRWIPEHTFEPQNGGTAARDVVRYAVLFDPLVHAWLVRPDVERIFAYRSEMLRRQGGEPATDDQGVRT